MEILYDEKLRFQKLYRLKLMRNINNILQHFSSSSSQFIFYELNECMEMKFN